MAFGQKEASRDRSTPTRLFLFRGADPALESLLKSVAVLPGATEFGYGTTRVTQITASSITDWDDVPLEDGAVYRVSSTAANAPVSGVSLVGRTQQVGRNEWPAPDPIYHRVTASDPVAMQSWRRESQAWNPGGWSAWESVPYQNIAVPDAAANGQPLNYYAGDVGSDFQRSLDDLLAAAPDLRNVTLMVAWHGTDLRANQCTVRPKVASATTESVPYQWRVGDLTRATAQLVSQYNDAPAFGGAPSDRSVFEAIREIKLRGLRCTIYPLLLMDIAPGNGLPDPGGASEQPAYPWRGRITCHPATVPGTANARTHINAFFGSVARTSFSWNATTMSVDWTGSAVSDWRYRKFILHMATIAAAAGADDFLLGGELAGLTRVTDNNGAFPAVDQLVTLANDCRQILGTAPRISYAADWTEFHSVRDGDNVTFHLDKFWAASNVNFVAIDNFAPISDWRDGVQHLDWQAGYTSLHEIPYLQSNIEGGESYAWTYASVAARNNQNRSPITDAAYGEPWVWRQKDFRGWWANAHHNRVAGVRQPSASEWVPKSKPIVFTAIGCAAVNKGSNWPRAAQDYKSSESGTPFFSNGRADAAIMRAFLEAQIRYWQQNNEPGFIETDSLTAYAWDARPFPAFPDRLAVFPDGVNWRADHHLTGRVIPGRAFESGEFGPFAFTDAEYPITRAGITYQPWPIKHDDINSTGSLDQSELSVSMAMGSGIEDAFIGFPPSQVINLTIFQGQMDDVPTLVDYPAIWLGRVNAPQWSDNEITFSCLPVSSSIRRPGLRRNYQIGCPHVLYGPQCRADRKAASRNVTVASFDRNVVTLSAAVADHQNFRGGLAEWTTAAGSREVRTIIATSTTTVTLRGSLRGLQNGASLTIRFGCDHTLGVRGCALHENFFNYGGQPMIPLDNPLSLKNQFY